jgi:hypothetical protein
MKQEFGSKSAFFNPRVLIALILCLVGLVLALIVFGVYPGGSAWAQEPKQNEKSAAPPHVVPMVGPVSQDRDLRMLPYIAPKAEHEERRLLRHPPSQIQNHGNTDPARAEISQSAQAAAMPTPIATFGGMNSSQSGCGCLPPDTQGDVGPNHYIQSVNSSIKIFDKTGTALNGVNGTTYNSFFSGLQTSGTPCGLNENDGDGFVFYDQLADRWVVSDFAFAAFPGPGPFYQCIGVSKTNDPVAGGWWLYALQVDTDPTHVGWIGDYPKFGLWPDAYYLSVNLFSGLTSATEAFEGVRVYALPRAAMINGTGAPNPGAVAFTILPAGLGDSYSLVPATFRAGSPPPAGRPEYFLAVDSPATADVVLTQVKAWKFHVDFVTPANSTFGVGADRTPDGSITVDGFVDAFTSTTLIVPNGTNSSAQRLDTLGDKIMTPLVYENLSGTESLWASQTVNNNQNGTGPTAIRWYQFDVTGGTIPATPVQQQTFDNGGDGLWRWMPSITVDANGNMAIGYSVSSTTIDPSIKWAGRLANDPLNTLGQGEALMIAGGGHQTSTSGRWGDYSYMSIDPTDNLTFWHTNEYYTANGSATWNTRVGKFKFPSPPVPQLVVSRMTHDSITPPFDIILPLTGTRGVEPRSSASLGAGNYTLVFTFANNLTSVASANVTAHNPVSSTGSVGSSMMGPALNEYTVNLTNVSNAQYIMVTLNSVLDSAGNSGDVVGPQMGVLIGDVNGNGVLTNADVSLVKAQVASGGSVGAGNFRNDVNANGVITNADVSVTKAQVAAGAQLP